MNVGAESLFGRRRPLTDFVRRFYVIESLDRNVLLGRVVIRSSRVCIGEAQVSGYRVVEAGFILWKRKCGSCAHGSGTMVDRSVELVDERPNDFHAVPRLDVLRPGAVVGDSAFHESVAVEQFDLNPSPTVTKRVPRSVGNQLGYDHSEPPAP